MLIISKTIADTQFLSNNSLMYFWESLAKMSKKWRPFWIFEIFAKIAPKHKNAYISKTVLDRPNFYQITHSSTCGRAFTWWSFRPIAKISLAKNGGHFEFSNNFSQKLLKHKNAKSIADSQFFSNNSFTYFWESFHSVKFQTRS